MADAPSPPAVPCPAAEAPSLDVAARGAAAALGAPMAFLVTLGERGDPISRGSSGVARATALEVALRGRLTAARWPLLIDDLWKLDGGAEMRRAAIAAGAASLMAVPLPAVDMDGEAGLLCVMDAVPRSWSAAEEQLLHDLAAWCAGELSLRRQRARREREEDSLRLLHSLSEGVGRTQDIHSAILVVLAHICQRTGWDYGEAWLPGKDGTCLVRSPTWFSLRSEVEPFATASAAMSFAAGEGLPGMVWQTGKPAWVRDLAQLPSYRRAAAASGVGFRAAVAIPILARRSTIAVLAFHCRELGAEDERLTTLVATAAAQLGSVLQRKMAEEALRRSEATLAGILHVAADAIVSVDAGQRIRIFNTGAEHVFGYTADEVLGEPLDVLLPEAARGAHGGHVERFMASGTAARWMSERGQIVGRRRDGEHFPAEATISRVGEGDSCLCTVVLRDVSERRRAERALADARSQLESILSAAGEGIIGMDTEGRATFVNQTAAGLLGYEPHELVGQALHELVHHTGADGTPYPAADCPTLEVMRTGSARTVDTDVFWRKDGRSMPVQFTSTPMRDGDTVRGAVVTFADISKRRAVEAALRTMVVRDELTELLNRRGFLALAGQQLALCRRSGEPCLLIYVDVDDFKSINDTHGHQVGDEALAEVAAILRDTFRQSDVVARLGGDEFVALAVHGGDEQATAILDRLGRRLAASNARPTRRYTLALSVGVAHFHAGDSRSLEELMADADAALYDEKRKRRRTRTPELVSDVPWPDCH